MAETVSDNIDKEVLVKWEGGFAQGRKVFTSILPFQMNNLASVTKYDSNNQPANK